MNNLDSCIHLMQTILNFKSGLSLTESEWQRLEFGVSEQVSCPCNEPPTQDAPAVTLRVTGEEQ